MSASSEEPYTDADPEFRNTSIEPLYPPLTFELIQARLRAFGISPSRHLPDNKRGHSAGADRAAYAHQNKRLRTAGAPNGAGFPPGRMPPQGMRATRPFNEPLIQSLTWLDNRHTEPLSLDKELVLERGPV